MAIVTLTTDFGRSDHYAALLKGAILRANPATTIVDITHHVPTFDIVQGAFVLKNTFNAFPEGTIHLLSINNFDGNLAFIVFEMAGHYFAGPDNGVFTLMFDQLPDAVFRLPYHASDPFPMKQVFAHAVAHITEGKPLSEIGVPAPDIETRIALQPVISPSQIRGVVIHVDHYENVITNIHEDLFKSQCNGRRFQVLFKRHDPITALSRQYNDVSAGEPVCLFNSAGFLEIAINFGKASSLLGLQVDDMVQVDFFS